MAAPRHLNFDSPAFHRTFPKAIAFELEDNVEKFIREFILEASPLDVREVRAALRAYDDTRKRLEKQEDEAAFLRRIAEHHTGYETSRREEAVLQHVWHALKLLQADERRERHAAELKRLEESHAEDLKSLETAAAEAAAASEPMNLSRIFILAAVDESDIGRVALGQSVNITADSFPGKRFAGIEIFHSLDVSMWNGLPLLFGGCEAR
jgi:hypothetical protein